MCIKVNPGAVTPLYVTKAQVITEGACVDPTKTQVKGQGVLTLAWELDAAEGDKYCLAVNLALCGQAQIEMRSSVGSIVLNADKTRGYFSDSELNFERVEFPDCIEMQSGVQSITLEITSNEFISVSSVELYPCSFKSAREADIAEGLRRRADISRYAKKGYGTMFHWTGESCPPEGEPKSYAQAVEDFDTERFAEQLDEIGAAYMFLTANHAIRHFPAPLAEWEHYYPGFTTKRDLIEDLYISLSRRNIDLMLYLNFTAAYIDSPYAQMEKDANYTELDVSRADNYFEIATTLLNAIGNRYGEKVKGYWIDSCYQLDQQFGVDFKPFYDAAKTGYEDRIVSFNYWILPVSTPWNDFWAGETARLANPPESCIPTFGPAKGQNYHELIVLEDDWGHFAKNTSMPDPQYDAKHLAEAAKAIQKVGGMLTINPRVFQDGSMGKKSLEVMRELKKIVKNT